MTIRYRNGYTVEAILLAREATSMRVAIRGAEDVTELNQIDGKWISEDCEPVDIAFIHSPIVAIDGRVCTPEGASRLMDALLSGDIDLELVREVAADQPTAPSDRQVM